jgi:hypothetical protein
VKHAVVTLTALLLLSSTAQAREDAKAHLMWQVAEDGCIHQAAITQQVEQRLGRSVFVQRSEADILLEVAVPSGTDQHRLISVTLRSQSGANWGKRQIRVEQDCGSLETALVLMLSLTADIAKEEVERRIQRDRLSTTSVAPVLSVSGVAGLLPRFAVGPQLGLGVYNPVLGWWELNAAWYPTQQLRTQQAPAQSVELSTGLVGLQACPLALHGVRTSVWACAVGHGGYLIGTGQGFDASFRRLESFWSAGAAIRGSWELGADGFLAASVGGDVALRRTRFYSESGLIRRDLFSGDPALFFVNLGLGLRL